MLGAAGYMVVAHVILVSAQVLSVLTLGLGTSDLGLPIDELLLEHVGLPHVLVLAVHLVIFLAG